MSAESMGNLPFRTSRAALGLRMRGCADSSPPLFREGESQARSHRPISGAAAPSPPTGSHRACLGSGILRGLGRRCRAAPPKSRARQAFTGDCPCRGHPSPRDRRGDARPPGSRRADRGTTRSDSSFGWKLPEHTRADNQPRHRYKWNSTSRRTFSDRTTGGAGRSRRRRLFHPLNHRFTTSEDNSPRRDGRHRGSHPALPHRPRDARRRALVQPAASA
jgi:hypothetical protein